MDGMLKHVVMHASTSLGFMRSASDSVTLHINDFSQYLVLTYQHVLKHVLPNVWLFSDFSIITYYNNRRRVDYKKCEIKDKN